VEIDSPLPEGHPYRVFRSFTLAEGATELQLAGLLPYHVVMGRFGRMGTPSAPLKSRDASHRASHRLGYQNRHFAALSIDQAGG
jgi:hypothetical protein